MVLTDGNCIYLVEQAVNLLIFYMGIFYARTLGYWRLPIRRYLCALRGMLSSVSSVYGDRFFVAYDISLNANRDMTELVIQSSNGNDVTTSLIVAQVFGKNHKDVLRDIEKLSCSEDFRVRNFAHTPYTHPQNGQVYHYYEMTKDGFSFLVMGYTGKKAGIFKEEYIKAFNAMEKALKEQQNPMSELEILVHSAQALLEQSRRIEKVEKRLDAMEQEREENGKRLLSVSVSSEKVPEISLRDKIRQLVNKYASATNTRQQDVWHKVYEQLYYLYHISIGNYKKRFKGETKLEIAERNNILDKIYAIISNMYREHRAA